MTTNEVARFENQYGEERVVHRTRHGLTVRRNGTTPILAMNRSIAGMFGERVRALRLERGWTLEDLCIRAGLRSVNPKQRMWEIENSTRAEGVRLGTIYALAIALGVEVADLLPSTKDVAKEAGVRSVSVPELRVGA